MKHRVTVTTHTGRDLEIKPMDTTAIIGIVNLFENPQAGAAMVPLEWESEPGPQKRRRHFQSYVRISQIESLAVSPPVWVGIRAMFLEPGSIWEVTPDSLGTGVPLESVLLRVEDLDDSHVLISVVAPKEVRHGLFKTTNLALDTFAEITAPVSAERLTDYGVTLSPGDTLGRYPTDKELAERLS